MRWWRAENFHCRYADFHSNENSAGGAYLAAGSHQRRLYIVPLQANDDSFAALWRTPLYRITSGCTSWGQNRLLLAVATAMRSLTWASATPSSERISQAQRWTSTAIDYVLAVITLSGRAGSHRSRPSRQPITRRRPKRATRLPVRPTTRSLAALLGGVNTWRLTYATSRRQSPVYQARHL